MCVLRQRSRRADEGDRVDAVRISKRLSYVLRHAPGSIGIVLDDAGWVEVGVLLNALEAHGTVLTRDQLAEIVAGSDKQRFAFDHTGRRIRASQGHSVPVALGYTPQAPPPVLFHGTAVGNVPAILAEGLLPGRRHAVHLSADVATARIVGRRHGPCQVLRVDAAALAAGGAELTRSANGVWLAAAVPPQYLTVLQQADS
jgi:putative RNA 2'-phosphotransferase